jgi:hypothetical protein
MDSIIQNVTGELADNWPAFLYILATTVFSICFLRERRAEARVMKEIGIDLQESIRARFDRLECLIQTNQADFVLESPSGSEKVERSDLHLV